jgi:hypothetical protein
MLQGMPARQAEDAAATIANAAETGAATEVATPASHAAETISEVEPTDLQPPSSVTPSGDGEEPASS